MTRRHKFSDAELCRLLSGRNELSVLERERLRDGVIRALDAAPRPWYARLLQPVTVGTLSAGAAVALGLVALRAVVLSSGDVASDRGIAATTVRQGSAESRHASPPDTYTPRGAELAPALDLVCIGSQGSSPCARGRKLTFTVRGKGEWRHFAAFAQAVDGTIYWYFPRPGALGIELDVSRPTLLDSAFRLGDEAKGPLTVYGVFSKAPLTRDDVKRAMGPNLAGDGTVSVVKRQLVIEEGE